MAGRRKPATRRRKSGGNTAIGWFAAGALLGVGIASWLFIKGYIPGMQHDRVVPKTPTAGGEAPLLKDQKPASAKPDEDHPRYDFYTVLPEMEVVVPDQELKSPGADTASSGSSGPAAQFYLQAGSFRNTSDAEELKARLALLGSVANIEEVKVNDVTWHRVRIGPLGSARAADELRRNLQNHGIEVMVLKGSS